MSMSWPILRWFNRNGRERLHDEYRTILINQHPDEQKFLKNEISTSKYSFITFLPKFLFEQFRKYSNIFFLFIVVIQQLPEVSPTGRFTTAVPLTFILFCAALKEVIEDVKRHMQDASVNRRKVHVFESGQWRNKTWRDVKVGDFVEVRDNENFPADLLFLSSSEVNSICYIETSNLDGETNLKVRQSLPQTASYKTLDELKMFVGSMECDLPNRDLYEFSGTLKMKGVEHPIPVNNKQILLRGSKLKNTKFIIGLVIYTGHDTKLMLNSSAVPSKQTNVERQTNRQILLLLGLLVVLCVFSTIIGEIWTVKYLEVHWYLGLEHLEGGEIAKDIVFTFLTFFILYNNLIPISLQITVDLVKFVQALFINWDIEMYDEETDTPANARTSNLNEELGQVKYIFSDKTGTLTRNEMVFKQCSIGGIKYGAGNSAQFNSYELLKNLQEHETREYIREFLTMLATCHTVVTESTANGHYSPTTIKYQASSPDECALVNAAKDVGVAFFCRKPDSVLINFRGEDEEYQILNVLEFSSDRKRMSVIVRTPSGKIKLYCKGADNIIMERLSETKNFVQTTSEHLENFAQDGLRTLCLAYRELSQNEYEEWSVEFRQASTTINNRNELVAEVAAKIEKDLILLGATGIEDRLQDQVPESLSMLLKAGIKVWVLTGDKKETAINIGFSCRLLSDHLDNYIIDQQNVEETRKRLNEIRGIFGDSIGQDNPASLIIDGKTLTYALAEECRKVFLEIALSCRTVICCRVTPKQKAEVVELVKTSVKAITLAIGDGANDVGMIQMAHVGIGIMGREGVQAACASDYSIGQFRFLTRLLFVHGVWNYRRLCKVLLYSFYKNICLYVMELWFAFHNGFSGQILFERWTIGLYNVIFTAAPPMALGLLDRCSSAKTMMSFPVMYQASQSGTDFNDKIFWTWILNSIYHSVILYFVSYSMLRHEIAFPNGQVGDYVYLGNMIYTYVVVAVCLKAGLESDSWTWLTHLAIWGSIASWFLFIVIYSYIWPHLQLGPEMSGMATHLFASGYFWFSLLLIPLTALLLDFIYAYVQRTFCKTFIQAIQEREAENKDPGDIARRRLSTVIRMTERLPIINRLTRKRLFDTLDSRYQGYAFSQEERGDVPQSQLIRQIIIDVRQTPTTQIDEVQ